MDGEAIQRARKMTTHGACILGIGVRHETIVLTVIFSSSAVCCSSQAAASKEATALPDCMWGPLQQHVLH